MEQRFILQFLSEAIRSLVGKLNGIYPPIFFPNEPIPESAKSEDVFFEIFGGSNAPSLETEKTTISAIVGSIVVNGKINTGISYVDAISETIVRGFSSTNPDRKIGFSVPVVGERDVVRVYCSSVERSESGIDDGRFKVTIFIGFECFEG